MFAYKNNQLHWSGQNLISLTAQAEQALLREYDYSGAFYCYNMGVFQERLNLLQHELPNHKFFYSVKSQSHLRFLKEIQKHDTFGLDVVSGGELYRAKAIEFDPKRIVFAGVGKTAKEIQMGLILGIRGFHVESIAELKKIAEVAESMRVTAPVALRLNPDIDVDTHDYIKTGKQENKFGISLGEYNEAFRLCRELPSLELIGLQSHLGSQIQDVSVYVKALQKLLEIKETVDGKVQYISLGGGFGIDYEFTPDKSKPDEFSPARLKEALRPFEGNELEIDFEPGRFISAYAGIIVCHVLYTKDKDGFSIAITDAGMNDLIRPALYGAKHPILTGGASKDLRLWDVVGPVCESGDFFAKKISLPPLGEGQHLYILHAGAYGSVMASNYNSRGLLPAVLIDGDELEIISRPQYYSDLITQETSIK